MGGTRPPGAADTAAPAKCYHCHRPLEVPVVCAHCHHLMPEPSGLNHFDRVGLPRRFEIDLAELERRYLAWSRELHPDYFSDRPASDQQLSLQLAAGLNDAYRTLRDPFARAEYLLALEGKDVDRAAGDLPPEFLEEMLELREAITRRSAKGEAAPAIEARLERLREALLRDIGEGFRQLESLPREDPRRQEMIDRLQRLLNRSRYVNGLRRELTAGR